MFYLKRALAIIISVTVGVFVGSFCSREMGLVNASLVTGAVWEFLRPLFGIK